MFRQVGVRKKQTPKGRKNMKKNTKKGIIIAGISTLCLSAIIGLKIISQGSDKTEETYIENADNVDEAELTLGSEQFVLEEEETEEVEEIEDYEEEICEEGHIEHEVVICQGGYIEHEMYTDEEEYEEEYMYEDEYEDEEIYEEEPIAEIEEGEETSEATDFVLPEALSTYEEDPEESVTETQGPEVVTTEEVVPEVVSE